MTKFFYRAFSFFLGMFLLFSMAGCSGPDQNAVIYYEVPQIPKTLDPQLAQSDTELMMVRNLYEGLMHIDESGEIVNGCISDYTFEDMTYTFTLSPNACWSDGTPLSAEDFVFAFRRAVDPATASPYASKLSSILNADLILSGNVDPKYLGVKAESVDVLTITLQKNDSEFLYKLTTAVCMPCNQSFFESCEGQYGLSKKHILTNGPYRLTKWNTEEFAARIARSDRYLGRFSAKNGAVFLSYNPKNENLEKLKKSTVDIAFIGSANMEKAMQEQLETAQFQNVVWVMEFSSDFSYDIRKALITAINRSNYAGDLPVGYSVAYSLFPNSLSKESMDHVGMPAYNISSAKALFEKAVYELPGKKLPSTVLTYYNDGLSMQLPISDIAGHWQNQLGAYINIQPADSLTEVKNMVKNNASCIAVYPVYITDRDPQMFVSQLGYGSFTAAYATLTEMQTQIMHDFRLFPLCFQNSVVAYSKDIQNFNYTIGNGMIDFSTIQKK